MIHPEGAAYLPLPQIPIGVIVKFPVFSILRRLRKVVGLGSYISLAAKEFNPTPGAEEVHEVGVHQAVVVAEVDFAVEGSDLERVQVLI